MILKRGSTAERILFGIYFFLVSLLIGIMATSCSPSSSEERDPEKKEYLEENIPSEAEELAQFEKESLSNQLKILESMIEENASYQDKTDMERAILYASTTVKLHKESYLSHYWLGRAHLAKKEFEKAMECFTDALQLDNKQPEVYNHIGLVYRYRGNCDKAIGYFKKASELSNNPATFLINLGSCYYEQKDFSNAAQCLETADKFAPNEFVILFPLSKTYIELKQFEKAKNLLQQCIQIDPQQEEPYIKLADLYQMEKNPAKTAEYLAKAAFWDNPRKCDVVAQQLESIDQLDQNKELYILYTACLTQLPDLKKAIDVIRSAETKYPEEPEFLINEVALHMLNQRFDVAEKAVLDKLPKFPSNPRLLAQLGIIYQSSNQSDKAILHYEKALALDLYDVATREHLANLYRKMTIQFEENLQLSTLSDFHFGIVFYFKDQYDQAKYAFATLKKEQLPADNHGLYEYYYGLTLLRLELPNDAAEHLKKALNHATSEKASWLTDVAKELIILYWYQNKKNESCTLFQQYGSDMLRKEILNKIPPFQCP